MIIEKFDAVLFLKEYWQKKPCLIKNFHPDFIDPIDENDLAGLAQETGVDSRIVSNKQGKWQVAQGPFESFDEHCQGAWSLLVQGVDRYINEVSELSSLVEFIPNWRFDDVMVSFSTPQAGVGAHTDEYDVFILQGKGSRSWQVGLPELYLADTKALEVHPLLKLVEDFSPVIDEILSPGDAIYIPPRHPHKGETIDACLNYSLGFRAPTNLELLNGILDEGQTLEQIQTRYTDSELAALRNKQNSPAITKNELNALKRDVVNLLETEQATHALLKFVSRQSLPNFALDDALDVLSVIDCLEQGLDIVKSAGVKPVFSEQEESVFNFFIDGNIFSTNVNIRQSTEALITQQNATVVFTNMLSVELSDQELKMSWVSVLTQLINAGYWEIIN